MNRIQSSPDVLFITVFVPIFVLLAFFHAYLLVPNYDDGMVVYHIRNTINFDKPFYNDLYGEIWPFNKLATGVYAVFFTYLFPFSFKVLAFIQVVLRIASTCLVYVISKNYITSERSLLASSLFFFYILTHDWLPPTRFEPWLLPVILLVILLCERFLSQKHLSYLITASIVIGVVGLPIHTNASILYIYFLLFLWFYRCLLSKRSLLVVFFTLIAATAIGLAVILYPNPVSSVCFMIGMASDGSRFTFLAGEVQRLSYFGRYTFWRYLTMFFIVLCAMRLLKVKLSRKLLTDVYISYKNPVLYALSTFIGLGFLPSADWFSYVVYYLLPVTILFSIQYTEFEPGRIGKHVFPLSVGAALIGLLVFDVWMHNGVLTRYEAFELLFLILPVVVLSILRARGKTQPIYLTLTLAIAFRLFLMYSGYSIYSIIARDIKDHSDSPILGHPVFSWVGENNKFVSLIGNGHTYIEADAQGRAVFSLCSVRDMMTKNQTALAAYPFWGWIDENCTDKFVEISEGRMYGKVDAHGTAIIGQATQSSFEDLMRQGACQYEEVDRIPSTFHNPFPPYTYFRDIRYYEFQCIGN